MIRPFSFLSGEFKVSMPAVFSMDRWQHSCTAERLELKGGKLYRKTQPRDPLEGVILYADLERKDIELQNILNVINSRLPCWPNPGVLLRMIDRHTVFAECVAAGFVGHPTLQLFGGVANPDQIDDMITNGPGYPTVFKTGSAHRGEGKHLANNKDEIPSWEGVATIEPFFKGKSVRVLVIGDKAFGIEVTNEETWIKNAAGADIHEFAVSPELRKHADKVCKHFGLDVAGVDYIVDGARFHLLEINQYPGLSGFEGIEEVAKEFLRQKMKVIENF
jgi:hypothetical protein